MARFFLMNILAATIMMSCGTRASTNSDNLAPGTALYKEDNNCLSLGPGLNLEPVENIGVPTHSKVRLPMDYSAYKLTQLELENYMKKHKDANFTLNFPSPEGCLTFNLKNSGTMSAELMEKYPNLISLRGHDKLQNSADVDFDGTDISAKINTQNGVYLFEPILTDKGKFYIIYLLRNSGYPKTIRE